MKTKKADKASKTGELSNSFEVVAREWAISYFTNKSASHKDRTIRRLESYLFPCLGSKPISANIQWRDIEALLISLGAQISEREGSQVLIKLFDERRVFHRPHPSPNTDKGAAEARKNGYKLTE